MRETAHGRAVQLDARTNAQLAERLFPRSKEQFLEIKSYLIRRANEMNAKNNPIKFVRMDLEKNGLAFITQGPAFDKGPDPEHFYFDSGARLSFGLTLREREGGTEVISFRFHYVCPEPNSPEYFRFDLNAAPHENPLVEPRCHLHPGLDDVRIPLSLYDPIEIFDRIFFGIDASF
jgi:hypothetical protein